MRIAGSVAEDRERIWKRERSPRREKLYVHTPSIVGGECSNGPVVDDHLIGRTRLQRDDVHLEFLAWIVGAGARYFDLDFADDLVLSTPQQSGIFFNIPDRIHPRSKFTAHDDRPIGCANFHQGGIGQIGEFSTARRSWCHPPPRECED